MVIITVRRVWKEVELLRYWVQFPRQRGMARSAEVGGCCYMNIPSKAQKNVSPWLDGKVTIVSRNIITLKKFINLRHYSAISGAKKNERKREDGKGR